MKRTIILIIGIIVAATILSSCTASKTCPTYSSIKKPHKGSNTCASNKTTNYQGFNY